MKQLIIIINQEHHHIKYFDEIKKTNIQYHLDIQNDIPRFENFNSIKINVFKYDASYNSDCDENNKKTVYNTMIEMKT